MVPMEVHMNVLKLMEKQNLEILKLKREKLDLSVNIENGEESTKMLLEQILQTLNRKANEEEAKTPISSRNSENGSESAVLNLKIQKELHHSLKQQDALFNLVKSHMDLMQGHFEKTKEKNAQKKEKVIKTQKAVLLPGQQPFLGMGLTNTFNLLP